MMRKLQGVFVSLAIVALFALAIGVLWMSRQSAEIAADDAYETPLDSPVATATPVGAPEARETLGSDTEQPPSAAAPAAGPSLLPLSACPMPTPALS